MKTYLALFLLVLLAGCSGGDSPPPPPPPPPASLIGPLSVDPAAWVHQYAVGIPPGPAAATDGKGWQFDFPVYAAQPTTLCASDPTCPVVRYIVHPTYGSLIGASSITFTADITETLSPVYQYALKPDNNCVYDARASLYFQVYGDTGVNQYGRWWSFGDTSMVLHNGHLQITVPLTGDKWASVYGVKGDAQPVPFASSKASVGAIGMTFGGGCFAGHGVNINGAGTSRFTAREYVIN
jgi:hypothetical protein